MIRRNDSYPVQVREAMRGGQGSVRIEEYWAPGTELKARTRLFARLTLEPGSSIGFHEHAGEEEVFVILEGRGRVDDAGSVAEVGPGDTILTGDGAGHAITALGPEPLRILAVIVRY